MLRSILTENLETVDLETPAFHVRSFVMEDRLTQGM